MGSLKEATVACRQGVALLEGEEVAEAADLEDVISEAYLYSQFGTTLSEGGQGKEGLLWCNKSLALLEPWAARTNRPHTLLMSMSISLDYIGRVYFRLFRPREARDAFQKAVDIELELVAAHPSDSGYLNSLGTDYNWLALALRQNGQLKEALAVETRALQAKEQLVGRHPEVPDYKANLAQLC